MSTDIITGVHQAVQDFVAPEIRELLGNIAALDSRITALEKVMEARFGEVDARFNALESKMESRFGEVNTRFNEVNIKLDTLLNMHNFEVRLARLEAQRSA